MKSMINIEGMVCENCKNSVEQALLKIDGVRCAEVNLEKNYALVEYDDSRASVAEMSAAIDEMGFKCTL